MQPYKASVVGFNPKYGDYVRHEIGWIGVVEAINWSEFAGNVRYKVRPAFFRAEAIIVPIYELRPVNLLEVIAEAARGEDD